MIIKVAYSRILIEDEAEGVDMLKKNGEICGVEERRLKVV